MVNKTLFLILGVVVILAASFYSWQYWPTLQSGQKIQPSGDQSSKNSKNQLSQNPITKKIELTYPNQKGILLKGAKYTITWKAQGIDRVDISLCNETYHGLVCFLLKSGFPANEGRYSWSIQNEIPDGDSYKVAIWEADQSNSIIVDKSNYSFGIYKEEACAMCVGKNEPICGQDGRTYPNQCKAKCAGTVVSHQGECQNCIKQGESGISLLVGTQGLVEYGKCCEGSFANDIFKNQDGTCYRSIDAFICTNCGNGVCDPGENDCNCRRDCCDRSKDVTYCETTDCGIEGRSYSGTGNNTCCSGMTAIKAYYRMDISKKCVHLFQGEKYIDIADEPLRCTYCGNGTCGPGENLCNCPVDCNATNSCGNNDCEFGENIKNCPVDCKIDSTQLNEQIIKQMVIESFGDCTNKCRTFSVSVKYNADIPHVTATYAGLMDDSIGTDIVSFDFVFDSAGNKWVIDETTIKWEQICQQGRGHQEPSQEPCL